jgi:DNA excision repair protein ERCC-6-like 2
MEEWTEYDAGEEQEDAAAASNAAPSPIRFLLPSKRAKWNNEVYDDAVNAQVGPIVSTAAHTDDIESFSSDDESNMNFKANMNRFMESSLQGGDIPDLAIPDSISLRLHQYQKEGIKFLQDLFRSGSGGILADEMGLGKTVQAVGFVASIKGWGNTAQQRANDFFKPRSRRSEVETPSKLHDSPTRPSKQDSPPSSAPVLVVCPASVLHQWHREFRNWTGLRAFVCHAKDRQDVLDKAKLNKLDVLILSYETFKSHFDQVNGIAFLCAIFDEAHRIKSTKSKLFKLCQRFKVPRRFGLTGTVIQNSFDELFSLANFVAPSSLGDVDFFKKSYVNPITMGFSKDASDAKVASAKDAATRLCATLQKYMLRRTKSTVSDQLPPKEENMVFCVMTDFQKEAYSALLKSKRLEILRHNVINCSCGSKYVASKCCFKYDQLGGDAWRQQALPAITSLQQLASHAPPPETGSIDPDQLSGKLMMLNENLPTWLRQGDRILMFSNSVTTLDFLEQYLQYLAGKQLDLVASFMRIDGSTPIPARQKIIDSFNRGSATSSSSSTSSSSVAPILLVSTRACGTGLNLSGANVVVLFEPNWNVSLDAQASDRAHRLGQQKTTRVYRLISAGSIEEIMYRRQVYKQHLVDIAHMTGADRDRERERFSDAEMFGSALLFSFSSTAVSFGKGQLFQVAQVASSNSSAASGVQRSSPDQGIFSLIVGHAVSLGTASQDVEFNADQLLDAPEPRPDQPSSQRKTESEFLDSDEEPSDEPPQGPPDDGDDDIVIEIDGDVRGSDSATSRARAVLDLSNDEDHFS